jgi:hypothetical protein
MGFLGDMKAKMAAAGAAESAASLVPSEVNKIISEIGWILQNGQEIDLRNSPEPNAPANARNATKKYLYNYLNFQQSPVKVEMYLVYMSMSATDCVFFTYVNGANAATFRMPDYIQLPPGGQPQLINRDRLVNEVRGFLQGFGSLFPPPPVQQTVVVAQPQPMLMAPPQTMIVTAPSQPQVIVAQPPPQGMMVAQSCPQNMICPRCGFQMQAQQTVTQSGYSQTTTYNNQTMPPPQQAPPPMQQAPPPQNVTIQMPGMTVQQSSMGPGCPRCGQGPIDTMTNRCMTCGWQF